MDMLSRGLRDTRSCIAESQHDACFRDPRGRHEFRRYAGIIVLYPQASDLQTLVFAPPI
jgi:hypothetical protein